MNRMSSGLSGGGGWNSDRIRTELGLGTSPAIAPEWMPR
jgi:hypothetical protein